MHAWRGPVTGGAVGGAVSGVGRAVRRWGKLAAGAALLVLLGRRLGSGPFLDALAAVSPGTLGAALMIGVLTTVLSAWRWTLVARPLGLRLPLRAAIGDYYRSLFLNAVLPGGVLGDVDRAVRHGRDVGDVSLAARTVVLERAAGQVVLVGVAAPVLLLAPSVRLPGPGAGQAVTAAVALAVVVAIMVGAVTALPARRRAAVRERMSAWSGEARQVFGARGNGVGVLAASLAVLGGHLATFVLAARAVGSEASIARLLPLALLALLAMTVPLNVGGWGPREGVTAWAFAAAGLDASQGLTTAVVYGLFALVASLPGVAVPVTRRMIVRRALRRPLRPLLPAAGPALP